ncbi:excalibur calcium-binding domain-containing protein [Pseudarthrobacter sp. NIBRBAC000502770]|uniref:excalibur calcium-binding domain-containing protein n=1 Tax=Pseudarthrobacter sp. NIBRBAC000502770 TaxID=2590785 RepID=UPI0011404272|nr:excalibur calcium-binding domain-containing protein [Pseudarthrobacter sp. NIBRBAC000502770]QDG87446.1 PASTA domain-containing protein [Pseudarthrobacter sp. NIBRBAC000502770]
MNNNLYAAHPVTGRLKKSLALAVLAGLLLTGCGGKQASVEPASAATSTATATAGASVAVPGVVGLTLDKATDQLKGLGFKVEAKDIVDGKTIIVEKNWQVMTQDPASGATAAKGSTVHLGVKSLDKIAAEKAAAEKVAADKAAAEKAAAKAVADKAAAEKAAADKASADQAAAAKAAADQAARDAAAKAAADQQSAQKFVQAPAQAPATAYYANCTAAKNAGAAPLHRGQPGYSSSLDRDGDGVACER